MSTSSSACKTAKKRKRPSSVKPLRSLSKFLFGLPLVQKSTIINAHVPSSDASTPSAPSKKAKRSDIIHRFHTLQKQLESAQSTKEKRAIEKEMESMGGLTSYQASSIVGHSKGYKFNTSKWVIPFLKRFSRDHNADTTTDVFSSSSSSSLSSASSPSLPPFSSPPPSSSCSSSSSYASASSSSSPAQLLLVPPPLKLRVLDVGALTNHYQLHSSWLDVTAIDLNPRHPSVQKMDFFYLPFATLEQRFQAVVLSLVLNFVGDKRKRGLMLKHAYNVLLPGGLLFIIIPSACVNNSRYITHALFVEILEGIGFVHKEHSMSNKLAFYVFERPLVDRPHSFSFKPRVVQHGTTRNNFSLIVDGE